MKKLSVSILLLVPGMMLSGPLEISRPIESVSSAAGRVNRPISSGRSEINPSSRSSLDSSSHSLDDASSDDQSSVGPRSSQTSSRASSNQPTQHSGSTLTSPSDSELNDIAGQAHIGTVLFHDTRVNRYVSHAKTLPSDVQRLLVEARTNGFSSDVFQNATPEMLKQVDAALKKSESMSKGATFLSGDYSSSVVEDLKKIQQQLDLRFSDTNTGYDAHAQRVFAKNLHSSKALKTLDAQDQAQREMARNNAQSATADDYRYQGPQNYNGANVPDDKRDALMAQQNQLQQKIAQARSPERKDALQAELDKVSGQLAQHHRDLADQLQSMIDAGSKNQKDQAAKNTQTVTKKARDYHRQQAKQATASQTS